MNQLESFFDNVWIDALWRLLVVLALMVFVVLALTWGERKVIGRIQMRLGPMRTGPYGILQPIADMIKILLKEDLRPATADRLAFELAPFLAFVPVFLTFVALPFTASWGVRVLSLGLLYFFAVSGLTALGYLLAGWASDNKYALLGAMRTAAQLISYEVPLILAVLALSMLAGSLNLVDIVETAGARSLRRLAAAGVLHLLDVRPLRRDAATLRYRRRRIRACGRPLDRVQQHPLEHALRPHRVRGPVRSCHPGFPHLPRRLGLASGTGLGLVVAGHPHLHQDQPAAHGFPLGERHLCPSTG